MGARKQIAYRVDESGCWICTSHASNGGGYPQFYIDGKQIHGHRRFYQLYKGPIPAGMFVCHSCDDPHCINPEHLFLGTEEENRVDMYRKRRNARGTRIGIARLIPDQVAEIRHSPETLKVLSQRYGVCISTVAYAKSGRNWKEVEVAS